MKDVLIIIEQRGGNLRRVCLSALSFGKDLASQLGGDLHLLVIGYQVSELAEEISKYGAAKVWVLDSESLKDYVAENYALVVTEVAKALNAKVVATVADTFGKDLMPRIAIKLNAGMASDISHFEVQSGDVVYERPIYAGNAILRMKLTTPVQVVTVRSTEFELAQPLDSESPVEALNLSIEPFEGAKFIELKETITGRPELNEANVIVSGGRGLKGPEGFKLLEGLADLFGAAIGATRAAVDAGWVPNDLQIGQTGKIVAPELYFAIGLSGAIQHVAGIRGSKTIVAINKDPEAPIFQVANYGLVADLFEAVPELVEEIKKAKSKGG